MTDPLTPTDVQTHFDQDGRHAGVYALRLADPGGDPEAIADAWLDHFDAHPPAGFSERAADASRLVYVGSHGKSVYKRVMQHAEREQSSTLMDVWPPVEIVGTWEAADVAVAEYNRAAKLAGGQACVWMDGGYL